MTWGVEASVIERFEAADNPPNNITCEKDTYTFNYISIHAHIMPNRSFFTRSRQLRNLRRGLFEIPLGTMANSTLSSDSVISRRWRRYRWVMSGMTNAQDERGPAKLRLPRSGSQPLWVCPRPWSWHLHYLNQMPCSPMSK